MAVVATPTDTDRLEALFARGWSVVRVGGLYRIEGSAPITAWMNDPRAAVDEAVRLDARFAKSNITLEENLAAEFLPPS